MGTPPVQVCNCPDYPPTSDRGSKEEKLLSRADYRSSRCSMRPSNSSVCGIDTPTAFA